MAKQLFLISVILCSFFLECQTMDGCTNYVSENNYQRSSGFILDPVTTASFCDIRLRNGWYRFTSKAGPTIPSKCPPVNSCGTTGSIWADGDLPKGVGDVTNITACVRVTGHCCASTWGIKAKKCKKADDEFYVYYLRRPSGCFAYCAGTELPCPAGSNSPTGFTPGCKKSFPSLTSRPIVSPGVKNNRLEFKCEFKSDDKEPHSVFEVTWYRGTPVVKLPVLQTLKGTQRVATIRNTNKYPDDPTFYLGTTISCRVRTWYEFSPAKKSSYQESNHYFAGITVEPKQLQFKTSEKGKPLKLTVKATVPIVCEKSLRCQVLVDLGQDNSQNFLDLCTIIFKNGPVNQTKSVQVYAKRDFVNDGNKQMVLKVDVLNHIDPVDWNQHRQIPNIQIMVEDVGTATCSSTGDPHLTSFDRLYYNHFELGDYVLVKSTCRKFEVHVRTWRCSSVSCNCGIAAREGDDVIVVDMCRDKIPRARFASTTEPAEGTSISRDNNGRSFVIRFPSGAWIKIHTFPWGRWFYANYQIQVPSDDHSCTRGMCGTFDGNINNEWVDPSGKDWNWRKTMQGGRVVHPGFSRAWKLPVGRSLFYYKGGPAKCDAHRAKHYCTCKEHPGHRPVVDCRFKSLATQPKYVQGTKGWKDLNFPGGKHCGKRKRRAVAADEIELPDDSDLTAYLYDPEPLINVTIPQWPTATGKTLATVKQYCENAVLNSEPGKVCKVIQDFEFDIYIAQCVEDIQITDNLTFAESAVSTMQGACEEIFLKNMSFWKRDPSSNNTLQPPVDMGNTLCPNLCSGHGKCVNATCICDADYVTADCSIQKSKGPTVENIPGTGLCDIRKRDCKKIRVDGFDFIDSENLTCRITEVKISDKQYVTTGNHVMSRGKLLCFREIMCELQSHPVKYKGHPEQSTGVPYAGYLVDISNDGKNFSGSPALYVIHDAKCMECRPITGSCKVKSESCFINGYCFRRWEKHPTKPCFQCHPDKSQSQFSEVVGGNCTRTTPKMTPTEAQTTKPRTTKPSTTKKPQATKNTKDASSKKNHGDEAGTDTVVIASSVVGAIVLIIVIILFLVIRAKKKHPVGGKLTEVATPREEHQKLDPKTFVNNSFEAEAEKAV